MHFKGLSCPCCYFCRDFTCPRPLRNTLIPVRTPRELGGGQENVSFGYRSHRRNLRQCRKYAAHMWECLKLLWNLKLDIQTQAFPRSVKEEERGEKKKDKRPIDQKCV